MGRYDNRPYLWVRNEARKLVVHLRADAPRFRTRNREDAADMIEHMLGRTEYLNTVQMVGHHYVHAAKVRSLGGFRNWWKARKLRKAADDFVRRIRFGEGR